MQRNKRTKMKNLLLGIAGAVALSFGLFLTAGFGAKAANTAEIEDNNTENQATELTIGTAIAGNLSAYNDIDYYTFTLSEPGTIWMTFSHEDCENKYGDDYADWSVILYDPEKTELFNKEYQGGLKSEETTVKANVPAGTYYLQVKDKSSVYNPAEYGIKIDYETAVGRNIETERNDTAETANEIGLNTEYTGRRSLKTDEDWYTFTLSEPGTIWMTFSHEDCENKYGDDYADWSVILYYNINAKTEIFNKLYQGGLKSEETTVKANVPAGTYYLQVKDKSGVYNPAEYGIKIDYETAVGRNIETERNDTAETANEIGLNTEYTGRRSLKTDEDWYTFTLSEPGTIWMTFSHEDCENMYDSYADWNVILYDNIEAKTEIFNKLYQGGLQSEEATEKANVPAGTYYLQVKDKSGVYNPAEYGIKINYTDITHTTMLRLYNPNTGEHFYTSSEREKNALVKQGWSFEGKAWEAPEWSNTPVYRLYNKNSGDHHYTPSKKERDNLVKQGWKDEGIGWYSDDNKSVPLFRLYNPNAVTGQHHYTTSARERDKLVQQGWKDEGTGWYGLPESK